MSDRGIGHQFLNWYAEFRDPVLEHDFGIHQIRVIKKPLVTGLILCGLFMLVMVGLDVVTFGAGQRATLGWILGARGTSTLIFITSALVMRGARTERTMILALLGAVVGCTVFGSAVMAMYYPYVKQSGNPIWFASIAFLVAISPVSIRWALRLSLVPLFGAACFHLFLVDSPNQEVFRALSSVVIVGGVGVIVALRLQHIRRVEFLLLRKHRQESEERIRASEALLRIQFESSPDHIIIIENDLTIVAMNRSCVARATVEELIGQDLGLAFPAAEREQFRQAVEDCLDERIKKEVFIEVRDDLVFHVRIVPLVLDGTRPRAMVFCTDITARRQANRARKELEAQLRQAQKMEAIGTIAGGIAHDFNNILTGIIGNLELVHMTDVVLPSEVVENLDAVLQGANRARDLVAQILAFSRKHERRLRVVNLGTLVRDSLKLLRASIPTTIDINIDVQHEQVPVNADPTQLHQVLMNLCTNAAYEMSERGGTLTIEVGIEEPVARDEDRPDGTPAEGRCASLIVSDTGNGIKPDIIDRIFDPFFTTKPEGQGTGMGLAAVQGIVKGHGGSISVSSEVGVGSSFKVLLSLATETRERAVEKSRRPTQSGAGRRILFVDDEDPIVRVRRKLLSREGYMVEVSTDPREALERFKRHVDAYDLLVTDLTMPGMNGVDLARECLTIRPGLPVILCSGFSEHLSNKSANELGVRELLVKPVTHVEMLEAIERALRTGLSGSVDSLLPVGESADSREQADHVDEVVWEGAP